MPHIVLQEISKRYGDLNVLDNINLEIKDGELCAIVGPSGSGKTTLLNIVAGFIKPDKGNVIVDGKSINHLDPRERNIGMVFQEIGLFSHMNVRRNISFGLEIKKNEKQEVEKRVQEIAEKLKIQHLLDKKPNLLSGGEAQRVAIGRTLITNPSFFLLDEPLGNLDANLRGEMLAEIKKLHMTLKKTFIYVTHDQEQALAAADRVIIMQDGRITQDGPPKAVYLNPANKFVAEFFGVLPMNMINGEIVQTEDKTLFKGGRLTVHLKKIKQPLKTTQATLGVRPENVLITNIISEDGVGEVTAVEVFGDKNLVYLDIESTHSLVALVDSKIRPNIKERMKIKLREDKTFLFYPENGERVYP